MARVAQKRDAAHRPPGERQPVEEGPEEGLVRGADNRAHGGMPALEGGQRLGHLAAVRPRLPRPRLALLDGHEVHEPAAGYEIVHEVTARAHPVVRRDLEPEMLEAI